MKKNLRFTLLIIAAAVLLTAGSCTVFYPVGVRPAHRVVVKNHVPPGQMKKITGEKSAKSYAPGQQKKKRK